MLATIFSADLVAALLTAIFSADVWSGVEAGDPTACGVAAAAGEEVGDSVFAPTVDIVRILGLVAAVVGVV